MRILISVDWGKVPSGTREVPVVITGPDGRKATVRVSIHDPGAVAGTGLFIEGDGVVSAESSHFTRSVQTAVKWQGIPGIGQSGSGMEAMPVTARAQTPGGNSPRLEYSMYLADTGRFTVYAYFCPTLNFNGKDLRYGISFDNDPIQILPLAVNASQKSWANSVANNIFIAASVHQISQPGKHVLKYWMVDPGVVLQKMVVDAGGDEAQLSWTTRILF